MILLIGIESTFDDLCISLVEDGTSVIYHDKISLSEEIKKKYGGVVPMLAINHHSSNIDEIWKRFKENCSSLLPKIDSICVATNPGVISSIAIGKYFSYGIQKYISLMFKKYVDVIEVNHLYAHMYAYFLDKNTDEVSEKLSCKSLFFVFSGGNTKCFLYEKKQFSVVSETRDDAIGEMMDKVARKLGYTTPEMDNIASMDGNIIKNFKLPKIKFKGVPSFSFSGIKSHMMRYIDTSNEIPADIARSFEKELFFDLFNRMNEYVSMYNVENIYVGGGVACSKVLRKILSNKKNFLFPVSKYCVDNAAMIAACGYFQTYYSF